MKNIACLILLLVVCIPRTVYAQTAAATVKTYRQTFTTYPFGDPDPVAKTGRIYPYFRYDGFTDQPVQREWTVVELENPWIKVLILPEIGGKIWTAIEKSTGKAFIYYNHVVKFRDIAMRGPWTSGGIEANYGVIGHTPACAVPVNYLTRDNPDGSTSCIISTLDLLTQTRWTLDISLPADKAYFATRSYWHNSMPIDQPYYTWMNVGLKAAGNLEFTYPGLERLGHEGQTAPWPIDDQGRDLRRYEQNNFGSYKSYHVFGQYSGFFGGYWHDEQFGMGRYATRDDKPGKKIWIWGLSRQGMIWDKLLTDTDGQYVEVQSGRLFNQSAPGSVDSPFKYRSFAPYATDTWTEYWFPVLRTGGAVEANTYGTLNAAVDKGQLILSFCPLQPVEAPVRVFADGQLYFTEKIKVKTLETWRITRPYGGPIEKIRVEIGDHLLEWDGNPATGALQRPTTAPAGLKDSKSAYAFYLRAKAWDEQREYALAGPLYDSALVREPYLLPALTGKSQLCYRNMQYEMAAALAQKALSVDTYDPAANYCWGLANAALGYPADAKDGFEIASQSVACRTAAFTELAKCHARTRDWAKVTHYAQKALETNADNLTALQLLAMAARPGTPLRPEALRTQDDLLTRLRQRDPFNIPALVETLTTANALTKDLLLQHRQAFDHDELPAEKYLAAAAWYADLRDTTAALTAVGLSPACPEKHYRAAWLGQTPDANLAEALRISPALVFPSRSDLKPALEWALQQQPHWKTRYYLGLLYLCRADTTTALKYWSDCADEPDFAPFYLARAAVLEPSDPAAAEKDLRRALALDPQQWRADLALSKFLRRQKQFSASLIVAEAAYTKYRDYVAGLEYAHALLYNGGYKTCIALLDTLRVLPYEGAQDARLLFRTACLMAALETSDLFAAEDLAEKAQSWPENLGSGKPYLADIDQRVDYYVAAQIQNRQGKEREANELYELAAQPAPDRALNSGEYASVLALRHLGRLDEARLRMQHWVDTRPDDPVARWSAATFAFPRANDLPQQAIYLKDLNGLIYSQFVR